MTCTYINIINYYLLQFSKAYVVKQFGYHYVYHCWDINGTGFVHIYILNAFY